MTHSENLLLYHYEQCPYCEKVRNFIATEAIKVPMIDILINPDARTTLIQIGGKAQVPCLVIDGTPLYESNDIIQWFKTNRKIL